jgi:hypothetical protein
MTALRCMHKPSGCTKRSFSSTEYHGYGRMTNNTIELGVGSEKVEQWNVNTVMSELPRALIVNRKSVKLVSFS